MSISVKKSLIYVGILMATLFTISGCGNAKAPAPTEKPSLNSDTVAKPKAIPYQPRNGVAQDFNQASSPIEAAFQLGHQLSKQADVIGQELLGLNEEECQRIGKEVNRVISNDMKLESEGAEFEKVRSLVMRLASLRKMTSESLNVYLVDRPEINAFAHVGGHIYVYKGLVNKLKKESELCFVLAHEVGHLELGHCKALVTYSARAKQVAGNIGELAQLAYSMVSVGYSEDCEYDADAWGAEAIEKLGYTRKDAIKALKLVGGENQTDQAQKKSIPSNPLSELAGQIDSHFQTHPEIENRIARLEIKTK
jgi:predicted Zn-dependent protease